MAIINKTGITDGGTIQAEHITRVIDALSGVSTDSIVATGSFSGTMTGIATSASFASTASYINTAQTASYVLNAVSASFAVSASQAVTASYAVSASYEINYETSSSYAETASIANSASFATSASATLSSSYAVTASFASTSSFSSAGLQTITNNDNITTNVLRVQVNPDWSGVAPNYVYSLHRTLYTSAAIHNDGSLRLRASTSESVLKNTNVTNPDVVLEFPNKTAGSYTLSTIDDLNSYSLTSSLNLYTSSVASQFAGTASFVTSASRAVSASFVTSASRAVSASIATSASRAVSASFASFATSASTIQVASNPYGDGTLYLTTTPSAFFESSPIYTLPSLYLNIESGYLYSGYPIKIDGGIFLTSPNGNVWKITITNAGALSSSLMV